MSRDFILILGGGIVSLMTTLVVLFASDYIFRRDELLYRKSLPPPPVFGRPMENAVDESQLLAEDNAMTLVEDLDGHAPAASTPEAASEI